MFVSAPYIKPCKLDAKVNECAVKQGREVIPKLINGKKFNLNTLYPYNMSEYNKLHFNYLFIHLLL